MTHAQDHTHSDLAKAFAALFASLIAAIAELAAEQPLLAPSLRMSIRQLEKLSRQIEAMVTEWQATRHRPASRHAAKTRQTLPTPGLRQNPPHSQAAPAYRRAAIMWNPATAPRAPPAFRPRAGRAPPRAHPAHA